MNPYDQVVNYLEEEVNNRKLPGAVVAIGTGDGMLFEAAIGFAQLYPTCRKMDLESLFDIASLTKVVATLPAIMMLTEEGLIQLDDPISHYIKEYKVNANVTIRQLLTHTSGLPPSLDFYNHVQHKEEIINLLFGVAPVTKAGSKVIYSDLNFMLLGLIIEQVSGQSLAQYTRRKIFEPLNMRDTCFNPPPQMIKRAAATEYRDKYGYYACGEVHDRNAKAMGGISGHAGLFSTVRDLSHYALMLLNNGTYENEVVLKAETVRQMRIEQTCGHNESRGLGWVVYNPGDTSFGGSFSTAGYGHTGFTGTSLYINPHVNRFILLLTNRLHLGRTNDIERIRKNVHKLVAKVGN